MHLTSLKPVYWFLHDTQFGEMCFYLNMLHINHLNYVIGFIHSFKAKLYDVLKQFRDIPIDSDEYAKN
jgi:hypothetical protein